MGVFLGLAFVGLCIVLSVSRAADVIGLRLSNMEVHVTLPKEINIKSITTFEKEGDE